MKTAGRENPNYGVAWPRNRAHGTEEQNRSRSIKWAEKQEKVRPEEDVFFLDFSFYRGGLNGSTQHLLGVYLQESENLRFFSGVGLSATLLCPVPTGYSRTGLFSSASIVVIAHSCFRSSRAAKGFADHRSRLSHW